MPTNFRSTALQVQKVAAHVGSRICTPRDMGALPALRLRQVLVVAAIHISAIQSGGVKFNSHSLPSAFDRFVSAIRGRKSS